MTLNDLKGLQMILYVSNKLSEVIWSHLSHEVRKLAILYKCNAAQKCTVLFLSVSTTDVGDSVFLNPNNFFQFEF
jgi:hypothetical protein